MNTVYVPAGITSKQAAYLNALLGEADKLLDRRETVTGCEWPEARFAVRRMMLRVDEMTRREASAAIGQAQDNNKRLRDELGGLGALETVRRPERAPKSVAYGKGPVGSDNHTH